MSITLNPYTGLPDVVGGAGGAGSVNFSAGTTSNNLASIVFSNANNVTFGLNGSTITASIPAGAAAGSISAGTTNVALGEAVFSNSNGISFGLNGSTLTAQHNALTSQSNQALSAANGSFTFQTANFADSNGVSFSTGTQGIFATVKTDYLTSQSNQAFSAEGGSSAFQTLVFTNSNGISFSNTNGSIWGSHNALTSQSNQAVSAANGSYAFQTLSFSNANGFSFGTSAGSAITGSYTVPTQTNQTIGIYGSSQTTGQSSSSTYDARSITFRGAGIVSVGNSAGEVIISATGGGGADGVNIIAAGTQTANTTGTVLFDNANGITFGMNNSSVVTASHNGLTSQSNQAFSAEGGSSAFQTLVFTNSNGISFSNTNGSIWGSHNGLTSQSNQAFSAAGGSSAFQTLNFADTNSVSFTNTNGSVGIASVKLQMYAVSNTTQSSSGTANHTALSFGGAGVASVGVTGGSVVISVPSGGGGLTNINVSAGTTSNNLSNITFADSNGISFGLNASTITAKLPQITYYEPYPFLTGQNVARNSLFIQPIIVPYRIQATRVDCLLHISNSSSAGGTLSFNFGLYTYSGSTANSVSSVTTSYNYASNSAGSSYTDISGTRYWSASIATWNLTPGNYLLAVNMNTASSGTSGTVSVFGRTAATINPEPYATATSKDFWGIGVLGSTTNISDMPASIHLSNFNQANGSAIRQPWIRFIGTG